MCYNMCTIIPMGFATLKTKIKRLKDAKKTYKVKTSFLGSFWLFISFAIRRLFFKINEIDFYELSLYKKSLIECSKYFAGRFEHKFVDHFDDLNKRCKWNNKPFLYQNMSEFINRDYLLTSSMSYKNFEQFCSKHNEFILKPIDQCCGIGVRKIKVLNENLNEIYNNLKKENSIIEEVVIECDYLSKICPASLNTVRVFTLKIDRNVNYIGACLRIGNGRDVIDNYSSGGFVVALDKEGKAIADAENMFCERFANHPVTGAHFKSIEIPQWDKLLDFINKCALKIELNYVAWDIAITKNGFILIEANPHGMGNVIQIAGAPPRKKQYKELYKLSFK